MNPQISCIIPAYNEAKSIKKTIETLLPLLWKEILEIIVVNDCSQDQTSKIVEPFCDFPWFYLINNATNLGKSKAVAEGIKKMQGNTIFLLDVDLLHLKTHDIKSLIAPILQEKADITMAFIKNSRPLPPFKKIDYCNGQRVFPLSLFDKEREVLEQLPSYWLEVFINRLIIKKQFRLCVVQRPEVENDFHYQKVVRRKGRLKVLKIWWHVIKISGGLFAVYKMNFDLEKLLIKS